MDGRTQLPVIAFLLKRFQALYVDMVTEPGPNLLLAHQTDLTRVRSILDRVDISVHHHRSEAIAVVGHADCAGNPDAEKDQHRHLRDAAAFLKKRYPDAEVIAVWAN